MLINLLDSFNPTLQEPNICHPFDLNRILIAKKISKSLLRPSLPPRHRMFGLFIRQILNKYSNSMNALPINPVGVVSHFAAGNEPLNALYSWFLSFITGNHSYVRISSRASEDDINLISFINTFLDDTSPSTFFVFNSHPISFAHKISGLSNVRFIWGSDKSVSSVKDVSSSPSCLDVSFGHKLSTSLLSIDIIDSLNSTQYQQLVNSIANDYFLADGFMCTSPSSILLFTKSPQSSSSRLQNLLTDCVNFANKKFSDWSLSSFNSKVEYYQSLYSESPAINPMIHHRNQFSFSTCSQLPFSKNLYRHFDVIHVSDLNHIQVPPNYQTLSYFGFDPKSLPLSFVSKFHRCVPIGLSHQFDRYWDGYDLFSLLTRSTSIL